MSKERIGFIGVGLMGHGMAANLLAKGWPLTVLAHHRRAPVDDLVARGASEAATPLALAGMSDIVLICVTGAPQVQAVIDGPDGLAAAGKPLLVVDCSTSDPFVTVRLAETLAPAGITLIDAPLTRTPKQAEEGTLHVMAGGAPEVLARVRPVLEAFSIRVVHTGPTGTAHAMKLVNNFLSMGYAAIYAEALAVARKGGITPQVFDSVVRGGNMDCPFYQAYFRHVLDGDHNAMQFTLANALKDMTYLASFAGAVGAANPVGSAVRSAFALAVNAGHGGDYVPALADATAALNGVSLEAPAE